MAIPNTNSGWSLNTVRVELGLATNTSLTACITAANAQGGWDPVYSGSKNSLLNFRNFVAPTTQEFYLTINSPKGSLACGNFADNVAYHNGASSSVASLGDTIYSNASGTVPYPAGTYGQTFYSGGYVGSRIVVDSFGVVQSYFIC